MKQRLFAISLRTVLSYYRILQEDLGENTRFESYPAMTSRFSGSGPGGAARGSGISRVPYDAKCRTCVCVCSSIILRSARPKCRT